MKPIEALEHLYTCRHYIPRMVERGPRIPTFEIDGNILGYEIDEHVVQVKCKKCDKAYTKIMNTINGI